MFMYTVDYIQYTGDRCWWYFPNKTLASQEYIHNAHSDYLEYKLMSNYTLQEYCEQLTLGLNFGDKDNKGIQIQGT